MKELLSVFVLLFGLTQVYGIGTPPTPTGLNSPDATNGSITLRWKSASGAEGYYVYLIPRTGGYTFVKEVVGALNTTIEITKIGTSEKLLPATLYSFAVRAYNVAGNSGYSEPTAAKTTHTWDREELLNCLITGHPGVSTPPTRTELAGITSFTCSNKNLTTMAPTEDLSNITYLSLYNNDIVGPIPSWITGRTGLNFLHLGDNNLTGEIPSGIDKLDKLERLYLSSNNLTGTIPPGIDQLVNLQTLHLHGNNLTGEIPPGIDQLINLQNLSLSNNNLTGAIPSGIDQLINLYKLSLSSNNLTGIIPSGVDQLVKLESLYFDNNNLTGTIPSGIDKLDKLERLYLSSNNLTGEIPSGIDQLVRLQTLLLSDNNLTGEIPTGIEDLEDLTDLHLYNNCSLYTNEESLQTFIDNIASSHIEKYQTILDTNSHDCNRFNPSVMMYLLD